MVMNILYEWVKGKIKKEWIVSFSASFIIGILAYGYIMANHFLTYDSMWNLYSEQDMISSGRQFLTYACKISSDYDLPWLNGVLAIFYMALTTIFICDLFDIKNRLSIALISGLFVTFPSIISTFAYTYTIDGYMFALLIATISVWISKKYKYGFVLGIILLGVSLGIYQAYLSYVMVLCVLITLLSLLYEEKVLSILVQMGKYIIMGIGGYVFYFLTLKLMLSLKGQELSGYQGTDAINNFSLTVLPEGLKSAFTNFINFVRWENVLTTTELMKYAMVGIILAGIAIYIYMYVKQKCFKNPAKCALAIVLIIALPFCTTVISILSPDTLYHLLMRGAWSLFFVFVIVLADKLVIDKNKFIGIFQKTSAIVVVISSFILIFEFMKMANIVGYNMNERYEKSYSLSLRIVEMLEETPGYEHGMKVSILGGEPNEDIFPSTEVTGQDLVGYFGVNGDYFLNSSEKFSTFMSHYMNVTINTIDYEEELELVNTEEFMNMEKFPNEGCVQKIDDVWVVKLNG